MIPANPDSNLANTVGRTRRTFCTAGYAFDLLEGDLDPLDGDRRLKGPRLLSWRVWQIVRRPDRHLKGPTRTSCTAGYVLDLLEYGLDPLDGDRRLKGRIGLRTKCTTCYDTPWHEISDIQITTAGKKKSISRRWQAVRKLAITVGLWWRMEATNSINASYYYRWGWSIGGLHVITVPTRASTEDRINH